MEQEKILDYVETLLAKCKKDGWFPDDDSRYAGYVDGLNDIIEFLKTGKPLYGIE